MATANNFLIGMSPETISAAGRSSEKLSLPALQSKMKIDPEGYETELSLIYGQFNASLDLFQQQAALNFTSASGIASDPSISKELGDRVMFLAHVTPFYPKQLEKFPSQLVEFLKSSAHSLPSGLRCHVAQALILLLNRKMVEINETLALFMELQTLGDKNLRKLAFSHVVQSIRRMNKEHRNEAKNRVLQNILFAMLQQDDEAKAKRALVTLCELHRRRVWFDERTANAICMACFHSSSRIMISALSFLLDYEKIEDDEGDGGDSEASSDEDDKKTSNHQVAISKQAIFKASHTGTTASKKKKKAKLQRAVRSMKRRQRLTSEKASSNHYSPLDHLKDAQGFAEKLFSRLQACNERFEVKMMMLKVISRTIGLHRLILLNFYPFLQKYVQPHQRDITDLLAAAIQACHDMVPPDAVEPLFKQIVNQFVHDRSRPEAIAVGLNVIREICLRMPLLMTEDLLQDLVLYRKTHEKAVSVAARSLMVLFREIYPSLLVKKDRGRPSDPKAKPKAFGEVNVLSDVPGVELLQEESDEDEDEDIEDEGNGQDDDGIDIRSESNVEDDSFDEDEHNGIDENDSDIDDDEVELDNVDDGNSEEDSEDEVESEDDVDEDGGKMEVEDDEGEGNDSDESDDSDDAPSSTSEAKKCGEKRKFSNLDLQAASTSLRALKRLAEEKSKQGTSNSTDGILSNEDFKRIKELKAKKDAKVVLSQQGFKLPSTEQLNSKRVDPLTLEAHVRKKLTKEEKLALVKAGREDRGKYQARAALKQKKTGGKSNQEKQRKKQMPRAALQAKITRNRQEKQKKQSRSGKQFRGKKAWK